MGTKRGGPTHGTASTYRSTKYNCRCVPCTEANTLYQKRLQGRPPPKHGTKSGYNNYGCRCDECSAAWREYMRSDQAKGYYRTWYARKKAQAT